MSAAPALRPSRLIIREQGYPSKNRGDSSGANQIWNADRLRFQNSGVPRLNSRTIGGGPHHHQSSKRHQRSPEPDPTDQRIERHANLGGILAANPRQHDVDVLLE